jgi:hypothetical protein
MAKRGQHGASEALEGRSERPATGMGRPERWTKRGPRLSSCLRDWASQTGPHPHRASRTAPCIIEGGFATLHGLLGSHPSRQGCPHDSAPPRPGNRPHQDRRHARARLTVRGSHSRARRGRGGRVPPQHGPRVDGRTPGVAHADPPRVGGARPADRRARRPRRSEDQARRAARRRRRRGGGRPHPLRAGRRGPRPRGVHRHLRAPDRRTRRR